MTATRRPEVIEKTLRSFKTNLFRNVPAEIIVNVDPVGPEKAENVLRAIEKYFSVKASNLPETAHFGKAFQWVWTQAESNFCFWLEDDWELKRPLSFPDMIEIMSEIPDLASLRLNWKPTGRDTMKNWKFHFPWTQTTKSGFFECPEEIRQAVGFCGHPSLLRGEFVQRCAPLIDNALNPEKQFHAGNGKLVRESLRWRYGVYGGRNQPPSVQDIGREWMVEQGYRKRGNKAYFVQWEVAQ